MHYFANKHPNVLQLIANVLYLNMSNETNTNQMNYLEFSKAYTEAFNNSMKYSPNEVGSTLFTEKMANLADDYPEFLEKLEKELDEKEFA